MAAATMKTPSHNDHDEEINRMATMLMIAQRTLVHLMSHDNDDVINEIG